MKKGKEEKETKSDVEPMNEKNANEDKDSHQNPEGANIDCDQDSEVSFMDDTDEEIDAAEVE